MSQSSPIGAPRARPLNDREGWFGSGGELRRKARQEHRCVVCARPLVQVGAVYCSRGCHEYFHARYFWDAARARVLRRDGYRCRRCGRRLPRRHLEVDHIVERVRGGALRDPSNLQTLCRRCHAGKTRELLHALGERAHRRSEEYPGLDSGIGEIVFGEPSTATWD